jgi:hypothetical protein
MEKLWLDTLSIAYAFAGIMCCLAYIPTVRDLCLNKDSGVNTTTYLLWTITALITLLYSLFVLPDTKFIIISVLNFVFCSLILYLSNRAT